MRFWNWNDEMFDTQIIINLNIKKKLKIMNY